MPTNTTNMALPKPIDSDNAEAALASSIPSAFDKLDVHRHTGGADGLTIPNSGLSSDVVLLNAAQTLTNKNLTAPVIINGTPTALNAMGGGGGKLNFGDGTVNHDLVSVDQTQTLTNKTIAAVSPLTVGALRVVVNDQAADALLLTGTGVSSNAAEVTVTFSTAFSNAPVVVATIFLGGTLFAYTLRIAAITAAHFTFSVIDSAAARVNGITINFIAFGAR